MDTSMQYAFFGTPSFAAVILERLIDAGRPPALLVCNPDRPYGRQKILTPPPTKLIAEARGIPVQQPESLLNWKSEIGNSNFDLFIVSAYNKIIPKALLAFPRLGAINVHPSLLPRHRGPSPIQTALLEGDAETGVTIFLMDRAVDHGPMLIGSKLPFPISSYTCKELMRALAELGAHALIKILPEFLKGDMVPQIQDEAQATYTKKFTAEDAYVPWESLVSALSGNAEQTTRIERMIRGLNPEPGVWTISGMPPLFDLPEGKRVKLLKATHDKGTLSLTEIQVEGKQPRVIY